jgi:hypothetical protein
VFDLLTNLKVPVDLTMSHFMFLTADILSYKELQPLAQGHPIALITKSRRL